MVRICPARFPPHSVKKLHARTIGPFRVLKRLGFNAYLLDLPSDLTISPMFNVSDLYPYRGTFEPHVISSDVSAGPSSSLLACIPPVAVNHVDQVEQILDDRLVTST